MKFYIAYSKKRRSVAEDTVENVDRRGFKSVAKGVAKDVAKDAAYNAASGALQRTFNGRRSMEEEEELLEREFEDILDNLD